MTFDLNWLYYAAQAIDLTPAQTASLTQAYVRAHTCTRCHGEALTPADSLGRQHPCPDCAATPGRTFPGPPPRPQTKKRRP